MQSQRNERVIVAIKRLVWLYFWLLIFEGALRKWVVPQYSDPLLIVRDPVAIAIYALAIKGHVFPRNLWVYSLLIIGLLSAIVGALVLQPYLPIKPLLLVTVFGWRSDFLHLPLIWVIAKVFDGRDVKRMGWWILATLLPLAVLMAMQFNASPDSFVNRVAGGSAEAQQITAGGGKIRPPATFSFISGVIFYAAVATSFLLYGALDRRTYRNWLLYAATFALVVATAVSGSRSVLLSEFVVVASLGIIIFLRPSAINQFGRILLLVIAVALIVSRLPIFKEGVDILSERFTASAEAAETTVTGGLIDRVTEGFTTPFKAIGHAPLFGYGLGIGTNAGAKFVTGRSTFLLSESEWERIIFESGPILGVAFVLWRILLALRFGYLSVMQIKHGRILPIILYSSCFLSLLNGQFGQPTNLGFAVLVCGLCLASMEIEHYRGPIASSEPEAAAPPPVKARVRRRSPYAERLHQTADRTNGSADR
ncbi:MAG: O-antigen ligase family protein [Chthoniobacterales bacterium]